MFKMPITHKIAYNIKAHQNYKRFIQFNYTLSSSKIFTCI